MRVGIVVITYKQTRAVPYYVQNIFESLRTYDGDLDVLFVDNLSHPIFINDLREKCEAHSNQRVTFSFVSEILSHMTLFQSINLGFHVLRTAHEYDIIGYSANDVWLEDQTMGLRHAVNEFSDDSVAVVSAQADYDNQPQLLSKYDERGDSCLTIDVGEVVNLHFMLFSRAYMDAFNFRYPDTLRSYGSENFISFCAAAIGKKWVISRRARLRNSKPEVSGKLRQKKGIKGFSTFTGISFPDLIAPGLPVGMGFQSFARNHPEFQAPFWVDYDHSLYENGMCKQPERLLHYLQHHVFLMPYPDYAARLKEASNILMLNF